MKDLQAYEKKVSETAYALKPLLTDDFLKTLAITVKTCGFHFNVPDLDGFVCWCHKVAGKKTPNLEPFDYSPDMENKENG